MKKEKKETAETKGQPDTSALKENMGAQEWIILILNVLQSMGSTSGIKPLQERMDQLENQLKNLETEIQKLRKENEEFKIILENKRLQLGNSPRKFFM